MSYLIRALATGKVEGVYASRPYVMARLAHLNRAGTLYTVTRDRDDGEPYARLGYTN